MCHTGLAPAGSSGRRQRIFLGKSEELIRRLRRARSPSGSPDLQAAHRQPLATITSSHGLADRRGERRQRPGAPRGVASDTGGRHRRGQFFDPELPAVCSTLADQGKRVIVAGLDQDYLGKPFEPMPQLLAIAEYITKTLAICMVCGAPANHTQRLVASSERVLVGAGGTYEARCRHCFDPRLGQ
jgi:thymidine kinase